MNEVEALQSLLPAAKRAYGQILIVDGGSQDGSLELAQKSQVLVYSQSIPGKGIGVLEGIEFLLTNYRVENIAVIDADMTCDPKEAKMLQERFPNLDIIVGTRFEKGRPKVMSWLSYIVNLMVSLVISIRTKNRITDAQSPLWILSVEAAQKILPHVKARHFDLEVDLHLTAHHLGIEIEEHPISYYERAGQSKFSRRLRMVQIWKVIYHILRRRTV